MLHQQEEIEKTVQRSLDRLQLLLPSHNLSEILPAFYYSADLLKKYSLQMLPTEINYKYFKQFKQQLQSFANENLNDMKSHEIQILDQMFKIINSDTFNQFLQPQIKSSRIRNYDILNLESNIKKISNNTQFQANPYHKKIYQKLYDQLLISYQQHRIDQAYKLKNTYLQHKYPIKSEQNQLFNTIQLEYNTMIEFYKQFDLQGWIFDKQQNGVTLQFKIFQAEKQIAIRIGSQFDIPVEHFLAILTEIDLMGTYIPFTYDSKELKIISRNEKIGTSKIYIPCLTDRQTYFYAAGYDRIKENGSIFLYSKTINQDILYQQKYGFKVPEKSDYIRLEYKFFIVQYIPLTRKRAKVRLASKIDMKLNFLPQFILNMSARKFAFDYFKNIIKMNKNFKGSAWEKKIKENLEFYQFFKSKVQFYLGKQVK